MERSTMFHMLKIAYVTILTRNVVFLNSNKTLEISYYERIVKEFSVIKITFI